jgi:ornithine decarboxylase
MATAAFDCHVQTNHHVWMKKTPLVEPQVHPIQNGIINPKQLIGEALHQRVEAVDHELCEPGDEDTFYVADLGEVYRQHLRWKMNLPRVKPFYGECSFPRT